MRQTTPPTQITTRLAPEAYAALAERAKVERRSIASLSRIILEAAIAKSAAAELPYSVRHASAIAEVGRTPAPKAAQHRQARPHPKKGKA